MAARRELLSIDAVQAQIDAMFAPDAHDRVDAFAKSPEGRAALQEHHDRLLQLPRPSTPEPLA